MCRRIHIVKTYSATEFKAKCLAILDHVNETGEPVQITKRGNIVAEVRPKQSGPKRVVFGFAKDEVEVLGDIMAPVEVEWDAISDLAKKPEENAA